jgi:hypothetical protein
MSRRKEGPLPSQDSEDEDQMHPVPKRQKTHRFETFAQRVAEVGFYAAIFTFNISRARRPDNQLSQSTLLVN